MYLVTDAALNYYFMYTVKTRLVQFGVCAFIVSYDRSQTPLQLTKYDKLVRFNRNIVIVSLSMDCLLIGMMSYPNRFMYTQANAMAFVVKVCCLFSANSCTEFYSSVEYRNCYVWTDSSCCSIHGTYR